MYTVKLKYILLLIVGLSLSFDEAFAHKKVRLRDVQALTLQRGQYTTGRRNSPVPQLKCVGGSAHGQYTPAVVQCYNRGFDGNDVQWECSANMPKEYEFGRISVSCEGFDYPDDPYILYGSCGLEYELNNAALGSATYGKRTPSAPPAEDEDGSGLTPIVYFLIVCFVMYLLYLVLSGPTPGQEGDRDRRGGGYGYGGGPGGGPHPPPPGFRPYPPSYDDATKGTYNSTQSGPGFANYAPNQPNGPGFFSGLGMGGLAGYFFGNRNADAGPRYRGRNYARQAYHSDYAAQDEPGPSTSSRSSSFGGGSGSRHTSTSFGGTSRR